MSILADKNTRLLVQGITGREGSANTRQAVEYGTKVVAGTSPGRGGANFEGIPIFDTVKQAVEQTGANTSIIFVPAPFATDAILEGIDAGLDLVVCITDGVPTQDMVTVYRYLQGRHTRLIGPNCPGLLTPGEAKVGIMPGYIHLPGKVGVVSRSGTLTYEVVSQLTARGIGQSTCIGIGGDPIVGLSFVDVLQLFEQDPQTDAVVMVGEIGGTAEEEAAEFVKSRMTKPVIGFIAGGSAPPGKRMGHAGAIISGGAGTAEAKIAAFKQAGMATVDSPANIGAVVEDVLRSRRPNTQG